MSRRPSSINSFAESGGFDDAPSGGTDSGSSSGGGRDRDDDDDPSTGASSGIGGSIPGAPSGSSGGSGGTSSRDRDDDNDRVSGGTSGGGRGPRFDDDPTPAPAPEPEPQTRTERTTVDVGSITRDRGGAVTESLDGDGYAASGATLDPALAGGQSRGQEIAESIDRQTVTDVTSRDVTIDDGVGRLRDEALGIERDAREQQQAETAREQLRADAAEQFDTPESNVDIRRDGDRFVAEQDLTDGQQLIDRATGGRFEGVVDRGRDLRERASAPFDPAVQAGRDTRTRLQDVFGDVTDTAGDVAATGRSQLTDAGFTAGLSDTLGDETGQADRDDLPDVSAREAAALGAAGVVTPEPSTSVGGGVIAVGAAGALAAAELNRRRQRGELGTPDSREPVFSNELGVGDVNPTTELETPNSRQAVTSAELGTPDGTEPVTGAEIGVPDTPPTSTSGEVDIQAGGLQQGRQRQRENDVLEDLRRDFELNEETIEDLERTGELPESERLPQIRDQLQRQQEEFVDPELFDPQRDPFVFPGGSGAVGTQPGTESGTGLGEGVGTGFGTGTGTGVGSGVFGGVDTGSGVFGDTGLGLGDRTDTGIDTGLGQRQAQLQLPELLRATAPTNQTAQTPASTSSVFETTTTTTGTPTTTVPTGPGTPTPRRRPRRPDDDDDREDELLLFGIESEADAFGSGILSGRAAARDLFGR